MKPTKLAYLLATALVASSCVNDDTDFSDIINNDSEEERYDIKTIAFDNSPLAEPAETVPAADNDYVENNTFNYHVNIVFAENSATVSGDINFVTVNKNGAHVTIRSAMKGIDYTLSGSSSNASLKVYSEYKYRIVLNGVNITNPKGAAINNQCGKSLYFTLADGTSNTLADGEQYDVPANAEDMKGTLFSEGQIIFDGKGTLTVNAKAKNAIASDDYIIFRPGSQFTISSAVGNGVKANDGVSVRGSVLNIAIDGDAAKGINSEAFVDITGGRTTIITKGNAVTQGIDTSSCAGIKADSTITVTAGAVNILSSGSGSKSLNANMDIALKGGEINIVATGKAETSTPKGIKSDMNISIEGGYIYCFCANGKPIEATGNLSIAPNYALFTNRHKLVELKY